MHLSTSIPAHLVTRGARIETCRKVDAVGIVCANGEVVFAKTTGSNGALNAGIAIVGVVAARRATVGHLVDTATRGAFLAREAIDEIGVVIDAIGRHLGARRSTRLIICRAGVEAIGEIDAVQVRRTRLQFVTTNTVECTSLARRTIHGGVTRSGSGARTIEASHARGTHGTASATIRFIVLDVDAFSAAFGQTRATRGSTNAI